MDECLVCRRCHLANCIALDQVDNDGKLCTRLPCTLLADCARVRHLLRSELEAMLQ